MAENATDKPRALDVTAVSRRIIANVEQVIVGKRQQIVQTLVAWFCEGHVLLEDVPGVAKTIMARAFACTVGCTFKRIQCTPDLLPTDVTGGSIFNQKASEFEFRPGPIFAQVVLADEINRATPRTQAALLEAMAESSVTIDGETHRLRPPFLIIATQNPVDHEGTFPLPEAQLDRFLIKLSLGYPSLDDEVQMLDMLKREHPLEKLQPVISAEQLVACQRAVRTVNVDPKIRRYITEIVHATRAHHDIRLGGSPRASIALYRSAQAVAAIRGRNYVEPDDVKQIVPAVLGHRIILQPESRLQNVTVSELLTEVLDETKAPLLEAPVK
ncbi:AAA family ATPase [Lacipirellula limnantheis]|uniref:ATPase family associated with various cellular activities (AAA) n=1 Tax=Lacipirellula limnantheis TaxID=2528024 RepID=A0A517TTM3_9BACT|nr:MoxR family ATPase [Lacipirellula limnantheis]QDT71716.1 ATPase family associated with various cellular activities (AAA) [Lacipirellula limnantheis]